MSYVIKRPWRSQPEKYRASSWARSRQVRVLRSGSHAYDYVTEAYNSITLTNGEVLQQATRNGVGIIQTGASAFQRASALPWSGDWTCLLIGSPISQSSQNYAISQFSGNGDQMAVGYNFDRGFTDASPGTLSVALLQSGVNRSGAIVAGAVDGLPHAFVLRKEGTTISAWVDGSVRTVTTSDSFSGTYGQSTDSHFICGRYDDGQFKLTAPQVVTAFFARALSGNECAALSRCELAFGMLFEPRRAVFPASAAAGYTHPTLSNARMGSMTATGGVPLVDYAF